MSPRIKNLQEVLKNQLFASFFISNQENVSYLTGFAGLAPHEREAFLFITLNSTYLLTFPTYFGLFKNGGDGFTTLNITRDKGLRDHLAEIIRQENLQTMAFEKTNLTVSELESLKYKLNTKLVETEGLVENQRIVKDETELGYIKKAAGITDLAFDFIIKKIKHGMSEKDIALDLEFFLKKKAGDISFSPIVAFNKHAAIPHYLPSGAYRLKPNSLILLDFGARFHGYCADMTRVIFFGTPKDSWVKVYNTVLKAQTLALTALKPNISGSSVDKIARDYIISAGFPEYPHGLGHGVGLAIHEGPRLRKDSKDILKDNMVVTVEPGIYLEDKCGVRIEDLVVLKNTGCEILSKSSKDITIL